MMQKPRLNPSYLNKCVARIARSYYRHGKQNEKNKNI